MSNFPKVSRLMNGEGRVCTQVVWLHNLVCFTASSSKLFRQMQQALTQTWRVLELILELYLNLTGPPYSDSMLPQIQILTLGSGKRLIFGQNQWKVLTRDSQPLWTCKTLNILSADMKMEKTESNTKDVLHSYHKWISFLTFNMISMFIKLFTILTSFVCGYSSDLATPHFLHWPLSTQDTV